MIYRTFSGKLYPFRKTSHSLFSTKDNNAAFAFWTPLLMYRLVNQNSYTICSNQTGSFCINDKVCYSVPVWQFAANSLGTWISGISCVSTVDHTTCPHRHTHIQLRNVSHNQSYQVFCLFCLRGIRRGLGVTSDRLFGIHTSHPLPHTSPSHPVSFPASLYYSFFRFPISLICSLFFLFSFFYFAQH